jgi:copper resistance protein C
MVRPHLVTLLSSLLLPAPLWAHAYLVKSVPAQRAVLYRAPVKIQLWFNERLEPRYSSFSVSESTGDVIKTIQSKVDSVDTKLIAATTKALPPGRYLVKFRVLSVDGHVVEDHFTFTIKQ